MKKLILILTVNSLLFSCNCSEPDSEYVKKDFDKYYSEYELVSIKNTGVSPPCFYWEVKYKSNLQTDTVLKNETWQYWETNQDCYWKLKVLKSDTSYFVND